jgi:hypothetical protein
MIRDVVEVVVGGCAGFALALAVMWGAVGVAVFVAWLRHRLSARIRLARDVYAAERFISATRRQAIRDMLEVERSYRDRFGEMEVTAVEVER